MERTSSWESGFILLLVFGRLMFAEPLSTLSSAVCPVNSVKDSIFGFQESECPFYGVESFNCGGVIEGDEVSLLRALNIGHENPRDYVAVLFYASWCPFSATFRPNLSLLSSLYPFIPHYAIEESVVRPSILSKYGVHGFPTLFLLNSSMRVRYHGSRTLGSLVAFYSDVTGITSKSVEGRSLDKIGLSLNHEEPNNEQEICPFFWARSPENLLRQETYLALATLFVILRMLYFIFPALHRCFLFAWRRCIANMRPRTLWEHPIAYLNQAMQLFKSLNEPCKRSNLQEGAMNAKAWASKSLASVSFGDASTSRGLPEN